MLPCRRGALLAKSASFKNIPEDIEIKHEIHTKIDPKAIQKTIKNPSQKWYRKTLKNITKNITNFAILGSHFGPILETFWSLCLRWHVFVEDLFSGTFAGCQKEPKWTPKGCQNDAKWPPHPTFLTHCSVNYASKRLEESWRPTFLTHSSVKLFKELGWGVGWGNAQYSTPPLLALHQLWITVTDWHRAALLCNLDIYIYIYIYTYILFL